MDEPDPGVPRRIGAYRLLGRLGTGGMGQVFLARSDRGRTVAVKLVHRELAEREEFRRRFRQEVRAARQVGGLWTAPVLDADTEAPVPWVATGYVAGPSLERVVSKDHGPLPERSVRILAAGLAQALSDIHAAGLVHRDLKPSNVLITIDGPRVIDFGIARALETAPEAGADGDLTRTGVVVGSPGFMAPEQVRGDRITPACDVFCLGSVLAYAATGRLPFGPADSQAHALMFRIAREEPDLSGLPESLESLVRDCLAKDPGERPSLGEILERTGAGAALGDGRALDPWLPGPLVAQLGRHAVRLLETEDPEPESGAGLGPEPSPEPRPGPAPAPAPGQDRTHEGGRERGQDRPGPAEAPTAAVPPAAPTLVARPPAPPLPHAPTPAHDPTHGHGAQGYDPTQGHGAQGYGPPMPPSHPQPAQTQPHQPHQPHRPGRRGAGTALLVAVALAVAVGAGGTVYAVMKGGHGHVGADRSKQPAAETSGSPGTPGGSGNAGASAGPSPGDGDTAPVSPPPGADADADTGEVPEAYLGTWTSSFSGQDGTHTRTMTIRQGDTGETVMTLAGAGPTYDCTWSAGLTAGGPPLELGPSRLVSGDPASCRPGERSVLDMPDASTLVRELVGSGGTPLTYTKTG